MTSLDAAYLSLAVPETLPGAPGEVPLDAEAMETVHPEPRC